MPYPSQIDFEKLIETAREMIEREGAEALNLRKLAEALGVQAPSLYRHIANKGALLRAVNEVTTKQLMEVLYSAAEDAPALERLLAVAHAFRRFSHEHPIAFQLAFSAKEDERPSAELREALVLPLQSIFAELLGEENAFPALRGAYAFLHGWVSLELSQQFERGGDLDAHFEQAFRAFLQGWKAGSD
jgi:AcrR family transcriptional regulator